MGILIGIVYGILDRQIRQVILPDNDFLLATEVLKPDEVMMRIPQHLYQDHDTMDALALTLGLTPLSS